MDKVVTACLFAIATGQWQAGDRALSIRGGAAQWGVSPVTVHQAYQQLAERGILRSESRRGYFVEDGRPVKRLVQVGPVLSKLYGEVRDLVEARTELSPLGVFRYLVQEAEREAASRPEYAFVECTLAQANRHAGEVEARLGVPCLALDLPAISASAWEPPRGLRVLVTTGFHGTEVSTAAERHGLDVATAVLECSPGEVREICLGATRVEIRSFNGEQGRLVAADLRGILAEEAPAISVQETSIDGLEAELARTLGLPGDVRTGVVVILSMYLWEALPATWRESGAVHPYPYRIHSKAWQDLVMDLDLPLAL